DSVGYACNLFNGQTKPVFGMLALVSLPAKADFINYLIQKKSICVDPGQEVSGQQVIDAPNHDFQLLDNSAAIDKAKKVFVPWGLYAVVGEWNFYKYPADINKVLDEHFYWNKDWVSLSVVQTNPPLRCDLFSYNTGESNFKMGTLENWIESAFELDGQKQYLSCGVDKCGLLDMDKDADGNQKINNFLIEAVLKINSDEKQGGIVEKSDETKGYTLALVNGYLKMILEFVGGNCYRLSEKTINDGKWHHIIAEVDRDNAQGINIYIDGRLSNGVFSGVMDSLNNISNNGNFMVGYCLDSGYLAATFDFLRISRGTLAQAETTIEELYDWESNGPFLKDFYGNPASGEARDVGAIEFGSSGLPITGDINGDGKVTVLDVQLCVNVILGIETKPEIVDRVNKTAKPEDKHDVSDVQGIVNVILK
ncbi:MAG: LamG-like jellyroll fold domain-containing protein, partial [Candidatus Omnitrophota bacterium]